MGGCQNEFPAIQTEYKKSLKVTGSIELPEMPEMITRGTFGDTEKANLKLTVFEFDLGPDPEHSFLSSIYNADLTSTTAVSNGGTVDFQITLKAATSSKVLHFFIADNYLTSEYGSVATILPNLTIGSFGNEREAYWGCVEFPDGFTDSAEPGEDPELLPEVINKLKKVPVIRNFAKISVSENLSNFELLGFDLVNVPTSGTLAPWYTNSLTNTPEIPKLIKNGAMLSYPEICLIPYKGIVPGTASFKNSESDASMTWTKTSQNMLSTASRYMYEHPYESTRRTYLIVHGKYTSNGETTDGFYKLDIGELKSDGSFNYYNIIRNIHYNITITDALAPGTATVAEAIARAPFNNLIAAMETSTMLNVSNGKNMLIVNDTNHIIIEDNKKIDILYRYIVDVTGSKTETNSIPHPVNLVKGDVIKNFTETPFEYTDKNGVKWMKIEITPNTPTDEVKTQSFSIVDGDGLGRTINLILRNPWQYEYLGNSTYQATIAPGTANLYTYTTPQVISAQAQQPLTVYFNLPNGLPESMFPLDFKLEAKYQGIENNKIGTLVVSTGPSMWDNAVTAISYIKTVSYQEYQHLYYNDPDRSNEINPGTTNTNHTIRCRFLTINAVSSGDAANKAEIRIHNDYFKPDVSVVFQRK